MILDANAFRKQVYTRVLATRGPKYKWFFRALHVFKFVSMDATRGAFLENYYALMRYLDDIVDGDTNLPSGYNSPEEFITEKRRFAQNPRHPRDEAELLLMYCFELGRRFGQEFAQETDDILSSMLFDARRRTERRTVPKETLEHYFHLLDVRGTIRATLKVFGENAERYELLQPLGLATRTYYTLRDYPQDTQVGLYNIPTEDCTRFNIKNLEDALDPGVQEWFRHQALRGMQLLAQHRRNMPESGFGWLSRITLPLFYEKPARTFFQHVLKGE